MKVQKIDETCTAKSQNFNPLKGEEREGVITTGAPSVYRYQTNRPFITNGRGFRSR